MATNTFATPGYELLPSPPSNRHQLLFPASSPASLCCKTRNSNAGGGPDGVDPAENEEIRKGFTKEPDKRADMSLGSFPSARQETAVPHCV